MHPEPMVARPGDGESHKQGLLRRLFKWRVGAMLARNTVVSTSVFLIGLAVLWVLVELAGMDEVLSSGIGFAVANTLHYLLARSWIFRGTDRAFVSGFAFFVANGISGLIITMALMAVLLEFTPINYLVARVLVSVVAGLAVFVANAAWNFKRV